MTTTTLRPEQEAALAYAQRHGTEAPVASIRKRLGGAFAELDGLLATVPPDLTAVRPLAGGWSIHEVADHLVVSHRPAVEELRELIAGREPSSGPIPAGLQSAEPFSTPWPDLVAEVRTVHHGFLESLQGATDESPTTARAALEMVVQCAGPDGSLEPVHWIQSFDWKAYAILISGHVLQHRNQVRRLLAALDG